MVNGSSSGFSMPKQLRNKDIDDYDLPKEEVDLSVITVERARGACCEAKNYLVGSLPLYKNTKWSSNAHLSNNVSVLLRPLPVLPAQRLHLVCGREDSQRMNNKGSYWFCGRCGRIHNWREGSRILSWMCGSEQNDMSLYRAFFCRTQGSQTSW